MTKSNKKRTSGRRRNNNNNKKRPIPLTPPPTTIMRSRKRARIVTTMFHKLTRDRDLAFQRGDVQQVQHCNEQIAQMGGRREYQRASQLSTSFFSTSKWVLGFLAQCGWLYGIVMVEDPQDDSDASSLGKHNNSKKKRKKLPRRTTRLLEVGAINTELLDAASYTTKNDSPTTTKQQHTNDETPTKNVQDDGLQQEPTTTAQKKYRLDVRAIDLHSCHEGRIEQADFLQLPLLHTDPAKRYDVVVCSMVLNSVTTPQQRGTMLVRLFHQLRPGGRCFLTLPKRCLTQSPYVTKEAFCSLLSKGIGFEVEEKTKESPKICFFILRRPLKEGLVALDPKKWSQLTRLRKGKKYRNTFGVVLDEAEVMGQFRIN